MDFGSSGRQGFNEEEEEEKEEEEIGKGKLPFTYPSSSSSCFQHKSQLASLTNSGREKQPHQIYDNHRHWMNSNWLGNTYEPEDNNEVDSKLVDSDSTLELRSGGATADIEKEHMFDKVVTPSDVGKLNRLVIPKQHAEKYFPLDSCTNEKGLLLNFEDRNGKLWKFRYSYWNSSQSYVMTKGWSRFVKDKKLHAGDIVSFQRRAGELGNDLLFIDWRRRPHAPDVVSFHPHQHYKPFTLDSSIPWRSLLMRPPTTGRNVMNPGGTVGSLFYLRSAVAPEAVPQMGMGLMQRQQPVVFDSVPVVQGKAAHKRLRLFGVNMECPISESDECEMLSTITIAHSSMASQHPLQLRASGFHNANKRKVSLSFDFDI